jgi:hypothetical protein
MANPLCPIEFIPPILGTILDFDPINQKQYICQQFIFYF